MDRLNVQQNDYKLTKDWDLHLYNPSSIDRPSEERQPAARSRRQAADACTFGGRWAVPSCSQFINKFKVISRSKLFQDQCHGPFKVKVISRSRSFQGQGHFKVSHMSRSESYESSISLHKPNIQSIREEERRKKEQFASTRPVGFAAGKNRLTGNLKSE